MQPSRARRAPSPATTRFVEAFWRRWDHTVLRVKDLGLRSPRTCRCTPQWPALETTHSVPVEPSEYPVGWPATAGHKARCARCRATYPGDYKVSAPAPGPFPLPRRPRELKCTCRPPWPQLIATVDGAWVVGRPGTDGRRVVNGGEVDAFCRDCGARHIGPIVVLPDG
ncbi:MAG: hypothetical protein ABJA34_05095 [Pseudonocardiales bacterium]